MGELVSRKNGGVDRVETPAYVSWGGLRGGGGRGQFLTCDEGKCAKVHMKPLNRNYALF